MSISATAGIAAPWAAARVDSADQAVQTALLKNEAQSEQSTAELVAQAGAERGPPPPPGQGQHVDKRA